MSNHPEGIRSIMRRRGYLTVVDVAAQFGTYRMTVHRLIWDAQNFGFGLRAWQVPPSEQYYIKPADLAWLIQRRPELARKEHEND